MPLLDGEDAVNGDCFGYREANAIKNHFRGSSFPTWEPGLLFSDEDDEKLWHATGTSSTWDEVLQETGSADARPIFDNLFLDVDTGSVSDPPTESELIAIFGTTPGDGFIGFVLGTDSPVKMYQVFFNSGIFYYVELTAAV